MTLYSSMGLAIAVLILAASPGPGVFATVARALASGFRPALGVICGIVLGDTIFILFAAFGLAIVAQIMGKLFFMVKLCGGAYLVFLGISLWVGKPHLSGPGHHQTTGTLWGNFMSDLIITLSNPKVILFYCGFLPTFLDLHLMTMIDLGVIVIIVTAVLAGVLTGYAFLADRARQVFTHPRSVRCLNRAAGGVMVTTGVVIATRT